MASSYLQDRVNEIARSKPSKARLYDIQASVDKRILEEAKLPSNQQQLLNEVLYEQKRSKSATKKPTAAAAVAKKAQKKKPSADVGETEEAETEIVTLLLVFQQTDTETSALKKKKKTTRTKKLLYCMTLWADGPSVCPASQFSKTTVITEYRDAVARRSLPLSECGCAYCEPADPKLATEAAHQLHAIWHEKFRKFFALRAQKLPRCKDFSMIVSPSNVDILMYQLVSLWKQVDPELIYFSSDSFLEYESKSQSLEKKQAQAAVMVAGKKAAKRAVTAIGLRLPREYSKETKSMCVCVVMVWVVHDTPVVLGDDEDGDAEDGAADGDEAGDAGETGHDEDGE